MNEQDALRRLSNVSDSDLVYILTEAKVKSIEEMQELLGLPNIFNVMSACSNRVSRLEGNLPRVKTRGYYCKLPRMPKPHPKDVCAKFWEKLTDAEFLKYMEGVRTYGEAMHRIPVRSSRYNREFFVKRIIALQYNVTQMPTMPPSTIPHDLLQEAINASTSLSGVINYLELPRSDGYRTALDDYMNEMSYDLEHFVVTWRKVTKEQMLEAFEQNCAIADIAKHLGCSREGKIGGSTIKGYFKRLDELGLEHPARPSEAPLDTLNSGQRRLKILQERGHKCEKCGISSHAPNLYVPILLMYIDGVKENISEDNLLLVCPNCHCQERNNGRAFTEACRRPRKVDPDRKIIGFSQTHKLALIDERGYECENCGVTEWEGDYLPLNFHHINVNHTDNRDENLQILCVNCHYVKHDKGTTEAVLVQKMKERRVSKDEERGENVARVALEKTMLKVRSLQRRKKLFHPSDFFTNPDYY